MDTMLLQRGHREHVGRAWHISIDITTWLIAVCRWKQVAVRAAAVWHHFLHHTEPNESLQPFFQGAWGGLWVMWLTHYACLSLYINKTWGCNRNLKQHEYWRRIKIIYGTLQSNSECVSVLSSLSLSAVNGETMGSGSVAGWEFCNCFFCP